MNGCMNERWGWPLTRGRSLARWGWRAWCPLWCRRINAATSGLCCLLPAGAGMKGGFRWDQETRRVRGSTGKTAAAAAAEEGLCLAQQGGLESEVFTLLLRLLFLKEKSSVYSFSCDFRRWLSEYSELWVCFIIFMSHFNSEWRLEMIAATFCHHPSRLYLGRTVQHAGDRSGLQMQESRSPISWTARLSISPLPQSSRAWHT